MATDQHTIRVRNAATHSYQPAKHLNEEDPETLAPAQGHPALVQGESGAVIGLYIPLHPHVQE